MIKTEWNHSNVGPTGLTTSRDGEARRVRIVRGVELNTERLRPEIFVVFGRNEKTKTSKGFTLIFDDIEELIRKLNTLKPTK